MVALPITCPTCGARNFYYSQCQSCKGKNMEQYRLFSVSEVQRLHQQVTDLLGAVMKARSAPKEESGWLVERPATPDAIPTWWHPKHGWTKDASRGLRFGRQEDAAAYIEAGQFTADVVASEHVWVGLSVPATSN